MRGRQSINPIKKVGLARIDSGKIKITSLGEYLLKEDYDLGEMFFRSFLKWQLPNPASDDFKSEDGFCIKPFIATLHFIKEVNEKWQSLGKKSKGISKEEFALFVPTLIDYKEIDNQAQKVIDLRLLCEGKKQTEQKKIVEKYKIDFIKEFLKASNKTSVNQIVKNLKDYGDNTIRYFRLTRYFFIRGEGFYIDLEPRRHIEINSILKTDNAKPLKFKTDDEYLNYISYINQPILPWETIAELKRLLQEKSIEYGSDKYNSWILSTFGEDQKSFEQRIENLLLINKFVKIKMNAEVSVTEDEAKDKFLNQYNSFESEYILFEGATLPFFANTIPLFELKKLSISKLKFDVPSMIDTLIRYKEKGSYSGKKENNPETLIEDILDKLGITYERGDLGELIKNAPATKRTVGFIIPNKKCPKIIAESSFLVTTSSGQGDKSKTEISIDLLIKKHYPKTKFIGFVDGIGWYVRKGDLKRMVAAYEDVFTFHKDELARFERLMIEEFKK